MTYTFSGSIFYIVVSHTSDKYSVYSLMISIHFTPLSVTEQC